MFGSIKSLQADREHINRANKINWICAGLSFISTKLKIIREKACNDFDPKVSRLFCAAGNDRCLYGGNLFVMNNILHLNTQ